MRTFLIAVIFLVAFTATGKCLQCHACDSSTQSDCSGELKTCDAKVKFCQTVLYEVNRDGAITDGVIKGCAETEESELTYREKSNTAFFQLETHYCETDGCNAGPIPLASVNSEPNGVKCEECFTENGSACGAEHITDCVGDMKHCLSFMGHDCGDEEETKFCAYRLCTNVAVPEEHPFYSINSPQDIQITISYV